MVDQATVKTTAANGAPETPPQAMARTTGELLQDMVTLAELQTQLLLVDFKDARRALTPALVWLLAGAVLLLSCLPITLFTVALLLVETTDLSHAQSFSIALLLGAVMGSLCVGVAYYTVRHSPAILQRSHAEWRANVNWYKNVLERVSRRL